VGGENGFALIFVKSCHLGCYFHDPNNPATAGPFVD